MHESSERPNEDMEEWLDVMAEKYWQHLCGEGGLTADQILKQAPSSEIADKISTFMASLKQLKDLCNIARDDDQAKNSLEVAAEKAKAPVSGTA